ncbi:MAG: DAK2 domain-containing protein, partial [Actinomycetota bacterium]|nr:DAK2 domain-containing protein [Actinomycetota bacterium]
MPQPLSPELFLRWCRSCLSALGHAREEIDALNVYPVPDNDTGTNLFLTFEAAVAALERDDTGSDLGAGARAFVDGALRGARGNSGVIMSQLLRACVLPVTAAAVRAEPPGTVGASVLADALSAASAAAYAAVGHPVEGTILS